MILLYCLPIREFNVIITNTNDGLNYKNKINVEIKLKNPDLRPTWSHLTGILSCASLSLKFSHMSLSFSLSFFFSCAPLGAQNDGIVAML